MKTLILMLIALVVGAACAFAVANTLAKRGAHGHAPMVVLAHHVDALKRMDTDTACAGPDARSRLQQIAFAAREIDFAYAGLIREDSAFARRNSAFGTVAELPPPFSGCADRDRYLDQLGQACQACHREFR